MFRSPALLSPKRGDENREQNYASSEITAVDLCSAQPRVLSEDSTKVRRKGTMIALKALVWYAAFWVEMITPLVWRGS